MKAICASLILALLVTSTLSAAGSGTCDNVAQKFLAFVTADTGNAGVATTTTPTANTAELAASTDACYAYWTTFGGCGTVANVNTYFAAKMLPIKTAWDNFVLGAVEINKILTKLKAMVATRATVDSDLVASHTTSAIPFGGLTAAQASELAVKVNTFATEVAVFKTEAKACFDLLINYRGAAYCYGFSAVVAHKAYFDASGILTIKQANRDAIAAACLKPWNFMFALGGAAQALAILNKKRSDAATAAATPVTAFYAGAVATDLYAAVMACPTATVALTGCTQANVNIIIQANFNLFMAEKSANMNNMVAGLASSQPARRVLAVAATTTGEIAFGATSADGADLAATVLRPTYTGTIDLAALPAAPAAAGTGSGTGSGAVASAGNIFAMTAIATLAAFVLTLN